MRRKALYFSGLRQVEVLEEELPGPGAGQLLVRTLRSGVSAGTEMLFYRGQFPEGMPVDESIAALQGGFHYPLKYGYSSVGEVIDAGAGVDRAWLGRHVFAFHPHESHFLAGLDELIPLPDGVSEDDAVFLPNMETAVNFILDGRPLAGEFAAVFGLGVVGLLSAALLAQFPLGGLVAFDRLLARRVAAAKQGVGMVLDPLDAGSCAEACADLRAQGMPDGFDLAFELSGAPGALEQAIHMTGFAGRVVIGSWYGAKPVSLDLGGRFHRSRMRLISSQVSTLAPELGGRWTKERRLGAAWRQLQNLRPARWITQRFPIERAAEAYRLLDERPEETIQVVFDFGS